MNDTRTHVVYVKDGLVRTSFGRQILFDTTDCLRVNQSSCLPPQNNIYGYTRHGLDALFNRYWEIIRLDLAGGGLEPSFNAPEFEFVQSAYPDVEGGEPGKSQRKM